MSMSRDAIAYIIGVFPSLTETFVVREILGLRKRGHRLLLFSLSTPREPVVHPDAARLREETQYCPFFLSWDLWKAQFWYLAHRPGKYLRLWARVFRHSFRDPWVLVRSWAAIPKSARYARIIERSGVGHLHGHLCTFGALGAMIVSELTGIPYSFTAHGLRVYSGNPMLAEKTRRARFVVCVSRFIQQFLQRLCPEVSKDRLLLCHYGVDLDLYRPHCEAAPAHRPILLCVAGLKPWKGVHDLVRALAILKNSGVDFECWHIGGGPEERRIRALASRLRVDDVFLMRGALTQEETRAHYGQADIFVLPSRIEGLPIALMEAMACGLPAVATRVYGVPELLDEGKNGLLVPSGNPTALAEALRVLIQDEGLRRKFGLAARQTVEHRFDLQESMDRLAGLFRERTVPREG
jgi:glycosyltransferase involved in cell wall biosynthesis